MAQVFLLITHLFFESLQLLPDNSKLHRKCLALLLLTDLTEVFLFSTQTIF